MANLACKNIIQHNRGHGFKSYSGLNVFQGRYLLLLVGTRFALHTRHDVCARVDTDIRNYATKYATNMKAKFSYCDKDNQDNFNEPALTTNCSVVISNRRRPTYPLPSAATIFRQLCCCRLTSDNIDDTVRRELCTSWLQLGLPFPQQMPRNLLKPDINIFYLIST